jgi:glycosyltransferase involved in cell wall biosynthesis
MADTFQGKQKNNTGRVVRPLVSIITIVFNDEKHIRQTIDSVLQQSYTPVEYIIIDGGSRDGTVAIIREYEQDIDFWQSETDAGVSDAFNKGIQAARGEFIGLINSGDWYEIDTVTHIVDAFEEDSEVGVVCGALQFWKGRRREYLCHSVPHLLQREMTVTHPTCFVRAELYHRLGLFSTDYTLAMDYELLLRFQQQGVKFLSLALVLANMQHDGVSEVNWKRALRETHKARIMLLDGSIFTCRIYYFFLVAKRQLRMILEKFGLTSLLHFYRSKLALVKKVKS